MSERTETEETNLLNSILSVIDEMKHQEKQYFSQIVSMKEKFMTVYNTEKAKLPYNINLLDEIHANENAHSRILIKLFQYEYNNKFVLLKSFLDEIGFDDLSKMLIKPMITSETNRIDARVREKKKFSLIIENKINGAPDQPKQIERYIEIEKQSGFDEAQIHILYLTSDGGSPCLSSFSREKQAVYSDRYKEISYRYNVLPWLKKVVAEKHFEFTNNELLVSAITQYKNFLEGKYKQREGEQKMTNIMTSLIEKQFGLNSENELENHKKICDLKEYLETLNEYVSEIEKKNISKGFKKLSLKIETLHIEGVNSIYDNGTFGEDDNTIGFKPSQWNDRYDLGLAFENQQTQLFLGIFDHKPEAKTQIQKELKGVFGAEIGQTGQWCYKVYIEYNSIVELIENDKLIEDLKIMIPDLIKKTEGITKLQKI